MSLPLTLVSRYPAPVTHERPSYSVTIGPDPGTGIVDKVHISGTVPAGVVLEVVDEDGLEQVQIGGLTTGTKDRTRSKPPLSTRLS